ncbi:MarR family winged helix-turn-helix transcriptional regulator [Marinomonas transparens]|uniref:MarR family transcriptional regulator n=1 Tax=Marinomonas transparens TaxID=2795388 RepID=A0A934JPD2_9GAMM|nr:MarR family transcriptional regulator [Marinomonas transparens]MBJ7538183.1 MarR family transcriptional regulator [Marinomonas transparens]
MTDKLGEALHKLIHSYKGKMKQTAIESGIIVPFAHIRALKCIQHIEDCSATDISKRLGLDKSQVARIIKDLLNDHYIEKKQSPNNHRSQLLNLTEAGIEIMDRVQQVDKITRKKMSETLTTEQIENFISTAETMLKNLNKPTTQD